MALYHKASNQTIETEWFQYRSEHLQKNLKAPWQLKYIR